MTLFGFAFRPNIMVGLVLVVLHRLSVLSLTQAPLICGFPHRNVTGLILPVVSTENYKLNKIIYISSFVLQEVFVVKWLTNLALNHLSFMPVIASNDAKMNLKPAWYML